MYILFEESKVVIVAQVPAKSKKTEMDLAPFCIMMTRIKQTAAMNKLANATIMHAMTTALQPVKTAKA